MPLPSLNQPAVKRRASSAIAVVDAHSISMSMATPVNSGTIEASYNTARFLDG